MIETLSSRIKDETGTRHGRLMVLRYAGRAGGSTKHPKFLCVCDCGNELEVTGTNLRQGHTRSCGCLQKENTSSASIKHGFNGTPEHSSYYSMLYRCTDKSDVNYERYGGRGITVCTRWLEPDGRGFMNFLEDMGERPKGMSINRIRGAKIYSPETCEWATNSVQGFDQKTPITNTSGKVGVRKVPSGRYQVSIRCGETIYLGTFNTFEEAVKAREEAELKYYGFNRE